MLKIRLSGVAVGAAISVMSSCAFAQCDVRMALFKSSLAQCQADAAYCGDVSLYREEAVRECGLLAVEKIEGTADEPNNKGGNGSASSQAEGKSSDAGGGTTSYNEDMPNPKDGPPRSCAYFTKPSYEPVRLNYHQPGAMVCFDGTAYECQNGDGVKQWVARAPCSVIRALDACKVEGTC